MADHISKPVRSLSVQIMPVRNAPLLGHGDCLAAPQKQTSPETSPPQTSTMDNSRLREVGTQLDSMPFGGPAGCDHATAPRERSLLHDPKLYFSFVCGTDRNGI